MQGTDSVLRPAAVLSESQAVNNQAAQEKPVLGLNDIVDLVRASATEISGDDMDENAHFASHHFDSLSAVELANSIGKAVGLSLPSKTAFIIQFLFLKSFL